MLYTVKTIMSIGRNVMLLKYLYPRFAERNLAPSGRDAKKTVMQRESGNSTPHWIPSPGCRLFVGDFQIWISIS